MEVLMLGTGASDGWPSAWCGDECCSSLVQAGDVRTPTSALIDRTLLIDPGPEAPRQALRQNISLAGVTDVLVSHAHHDHLDAAFLLHRSWVSQQPLRVVGPKPVIDECARWLKPGQTSVQLVPITAGRDVSLGKYRVRALPAAHEALGEACLYAIAGPDATMLWATDTGPWARGVKEMLAGTRFDLVCMEQTFGERDDLTEGKHHSLRTFAEAVAQLREWGSATGTTDVVAVHLGHHNPPPELLYLKLRDMGARAVPDGTPIIAGGVLSSLSL
jgi:adenosylcobinamide kinase/adenosylcobinamide-phosphate guanylyltransferase